MTNMQPLRAQDESLLRRAFALAETARRAGHRPFGAVIADGASIVVEVGSTQTAQGDPTAHAEMNAVRRLGASAAREHAAGLTLFASAEPCAMCACAIYFSGIRRIVFGIGEGTLRPMRNQTAQGSGIALTCRSVLARVAEPMSITGPCLETEAVVAHQDYWHDAI